MSKEEHLPQPKFALSELSIQSFPPQSSQHYPQVLCMLLLRLEVDQDVINEYDDKQLWQLFLELQMMTMLD